MKYPKDTSGDQYDQWFSSTRGTEIEYEDEDDVDEVDFDNMEDDKE